MTSDGRPWFPLFVDDFIGDEAVKLMDNRGLGAFMRLLCHQWRHKSVPADPAQLARICQETVEHFEVLWPQMADKFRAMRGRRRAGVGPRLVNPKLEAVRHQQDVGSRKLRGAWQPDGKEVATDGQISGLNPNPDIKKITGPEDPNWVRVLASLWRAQYEGESPSFGVLGKHLKKLHEVHGLDVLRERWITYLKVTPGQYASAARFAQTFGEWAPKKSGLRDAYLTPEQMREEA